MMADHIRFERQNHLGVITLARPQALNALNLPMITAMQDILLEWEADASIHAIVMTAEPGKAFCAGGDVRWLYQAGINKDPQQMAFFWHEYRLNYFIHRLSKPYVVLMDGITMGGGVGISLHGSHPVASRNSRFAMPETNIGFFPDIGASYLLSRCPGQVGLYLALTGHSLAAEDARSAGLVKHVVSAKALAGILPHLRAMDLSQGAHERIHLYIQDMAEAVLNTPLMNELENINYFFAASSLKDILAGLEASADPWAEATLHHLKKKSPMSLAVTFAQIRRANGLSLAECLVMDYCLAGHFMADNDFYEGIRAVLIDKDKTPHWQPQSLDQLSASVVASYFEYRQPMLDFNRHF